MGLDGSVRCRSRVGIYDRGAGHRPHLGASSLGNLVDLGRAADFDVCALVALCFLFIASNARGRTRPPRFVERAIREAREAATPSAKDDAKEKASELTKLRTQQKEELKEIEKEVAETPCAFINFSD